MKDILRNKWSLLKNRFKSLHSEDKAGIYVTVTIHVAVIIVMLIWQISSVLSSETSYLFDFSQIEQQERLQAEAEFQESITRRLDELISAAPLPPSEIRNVAVDASEAPLKDDRNTDVDELYNDIARLEAELNKNAENARKAAEDFVDLNENSASEKPKEEKPGYTGPSVVSYSLDGRKATDLSIPAYRCLGGGDVVVTIKVNRAGEVVHAKISEAFSSSDKCLRNFAVRAARLSTFTASTTAPDPQIGEIVYRFIAQ